MTVKTSFVKSFYFILLKSYKELIKNDPLRLAGATAFFTTFALPPILLILIEAMSLLLDPQKISHTLFHDLSKVIGKESMKQVVDILTGFRKLAQNWFISIGGFLFMIFVASTLFIVIKQSLNQVWKIRLVKKETFSHKMKSRMLSIILILFAGILTLASLFLNALKKYIGNYLLELSPQMMHYLNSIFGHIISILIVSTWFALLFRILPDGRPSWKVSFIGGFITGILFSLGRILLNAFLIHSNLDLIYRASGSIILLLLFVFYSSFILYFGAAFTKAWGEFYGQKITPLPHAAYYHLEENIK